jgi:hypothetical protein
MMTAVSRTVSRTICSHSGKMLLNTTPAIHHSETVGSPVWMCSGWFAAYQRCSGHADRAFTYWWKEKCSEIYVVLDIYCWTEKCTKHIPKISTGGISTAGKRNVSNISQ